MKTKLALLILLPATLVLGACAADATDSAEDAVPTEDELSRTSAGAILGSGDNGKTFTLEVGKKITVNLTYGGLVASPFGKYEVTTKGGLASPRITVRTPRIPDAPTTETLEWSTLHASLGMHTVVLTAKSLNGGKPRTFTFTVKIIAPKVTGAKEGQTCGGIAAIACADGLNCQTTGPNHPDQAGTCRKPFTGGALGATCGGIAGLPCKEGLECVAIPRYPDATGTCALVN
jgi:hypothetical protein